MPELEINYLLLLLLFTVLTMHICVKDVHAGRQALHLHPLPHHVLGTAVPVILKV
jgi:hypothetical protein